MNILFSPVMNGHESLNILVVTKTFPTFFATARFYSSMYMFLMRFGVILSTECVGTVRININCIANKQKVVP